MILIVNLDIPSYNVWYLVVVVLAATERETAL